MFHLKQQQRIFLAKLGTIRIYSLQLILLRVLVLGSLHVHLMDTKEQDSTSTLIYLVYAMLCTPM